MAIFTRMLGFQPSDLGLPASIYICYLGFDNSLCIFPIYYLWRRVIIIGWLLRRRLQSISNQPTLERIVLYHPQRSCQWDRSSPVLFVRTTSAGRLVVFYRVVVRTMRGCCSFLSIRSMWPRSFSWRDLTVTISGEVPVKM